MTDYPYMNDACETCVYKTEDDHCKILKIHCGAVLMCPEYKEIISEKGEVE